MAMTASTANAAAAFCQRRARLGVSVTTVAVEAIALAGSVAAALVPLAGVMVATPGELLGACWKTASRTAPAEDVGITAAETRLEPVSRLTRARSVRNSAACW